MKTFLPLLAFLLSTTLAIAGPALNISSRSMNSFYYVTGAGTSSTQKTQLQSHLMGSMSGSGSINISGTTHFELSLDNATFKSALSIPYSDDTLGTTDVYIRLKSGLAAGAYNHESVSITAPGAGVSSTSIDVSGLVTPAPLLASVVNVGPKSAGLMWSTLSSTPDGWEYILDQKPNAPLVAGTPTTTIGYTATGLTPATTYYFHVRSVYGINYTSWTTASFKTPAAAGLEPGELQPYLAVVPNPSTGKFRVSGIVSATGNEDVRIQVVNITGQIVWSSSTRPNAGEISVDVSASLPAGMYVVRVASSAGSNEIQLRITN